MSRLNVTEGVSLLNMAVLLNIWAKQRGWEMAGWNDLTSILIVCGLLLYVAPLLGDAVGPVAETTLSRFRSDSE